VIIGTITIDMKKVRQRKWDMVEAESSRPAGHGEVFNEYFAMCGRIGRPFLQFDRSAPAKFHPVARLFT
jgi:hypothetical protein